MDIGAIQHLGDADAWRRDRRKDAALQANGYFVLRFLAVDLGKNLEFVLEAVRRTLVTRVRRAQYY